MSETLRGVEVNRGLGALTLALLRDWDGWVHRRVESISLEDPVTFLRRVSLDFTLYRDWPTTTFTSSGEPIHFVPLTLPAKATLTRFSVCDEQGAALPILTKQRNGALAASVLVALAEGLVSEEFRREHGENLPSDLEFDLWRVATLSTDRASVIADRLETGAEPSAATEDPVPVSDERSTAWRNELKDKAEFRRVVRLLAESFILAVPLVGSPGDRRIIKFSYEEQGDSPELALPPPLARLAHRWVRQVSGTYRGPLASPRRYTPLPVWIARAVGWRAKALQIDTPALAHGGSYHLEIDAPEGLKITRAKLESENPRKLLCEVRRSLRRIHLYAAERPSQLTGGTAVVNVRPEASGLVRGAWLTSAFTTIVLAAVAIRWREIVVNLSPALSLLLIVPAGLSAYVARGREPSVVTEVLFGLRLLAVSSGLWAFAAGVLLLLGTSCSGQQSDATAASCSSWSATGPLLWLLVGTSLAIFLVLHVTLTLIARPAEQRTPASPA